MPGDDVDWLSDETVEAIVVERVRSDDFRNKAVQLAWKHLTSLDQLPEPESWREAKNAMEVLDKVVKITQSVEMLELQRQVDKLSPEARRQMFAELTDRAKALSPGHAPVDATPE